MALHQLGTVASTSLRAITFNPSPTLLLPADCAAIYESIVGDDRFAALNPTGILATGSVHSNATLDTLVSAAGAPLAAIQPGMLVLASSILPGTFVQAINAATSVTLSQGATSTASGVFVGFVPRDAISNSGLIIGLLRLPGGRGTIKVNLGDVIAIDNTGWPIVVSAASLAYAGSQWNYV